MVKAEFLIERNGRTFVLYAGLLDMGHQQGLKAIRTKLLQVPSEDNAQTAIVAAEVETERGTFSGIGDANPSNVSKQMLTCTIRLAETRAKARALRDAVNVGVTAFEELGDDQVEQHVAPTPAAAPVRPVAEPTPITRPTPAAIAADSEPRATPNQLRAINRISADMGLTDAEIKRRFGFDVDHLTKRSASDLIDALKKDGGSRVMMA